MLLRRIGSALRAIRFALALGPTGQVARLFLRAVPEMLIGRVGIYAIARIPGRRTKVVVRSHHPAADAVGTFVGARGQRVQWVVERLGGERIDLIPWNEDPRRLIRFTLAPARLGDVTLQPADRKALVALAEDQMRIAMGDGGDNRELASRVSGWRIELIVR